MMGNLSVESICVISFSESPDCRLPFCCDFKLVPRSSTYWVRGERGEDGLIRWDTQPGAQGYNIKWGLAPGKLYHSWMVYDAGSLLLKSLATDQSYYFSIEAFNENGISTALPPVRIN